MFLSKVFIAYDSKYGNTKLAAESIMEGITESGKLEAAIGYVKDSDSSKFLNCDTIVLGAPNHMGRPSWAMKKFIDCLADSNHKIKYVAVFDTYSGKARMDRAVKKLELMVKKKLPNVNLILPGLSVRVHGIPGPLVDGELLKCVDYGRKIATQLELLE
jgi:flavorubredoxin